MKKLLSIITLFMLLAITANAQKNNREKIKVLKTSYLTEVLELTPSEAEKFWPIYNLSNSNIQTLRKSLEVEMKKEITQVGDLDNLTEIEAKAFVEKTVQIQNKIALAKSAMIHDLIKVISAKKIIKLRKAERDFNKRLLQEYGKRKKQ